MSCPCVCVADAHTRLILTIAENVCLVSWAAAPCVWTLRVPSRNFLNYLLTYMYRIIVSNTEICFFFCKQVRLNWNLIQYAEWCRFWLKSKNFSPLRHEITLYAPPGECLYKCSLMPCCVAVAVLMSSFLLLAKKNYEITDVFIILF